MKYCRVCVFELEDNFSCCYFVWNCQYVFGILEITDKFFYTSFSTVWNPIDSPSHAILYWSPIRFQNFGFYIMLETKKSNIYCYDTSESCQWLGSCSGYNSWVMFSPYFPSPHQCDTPCWKLSPPSVSLGVVWYLICNNLVMAPFLYLPYTGCVGGVDGGEESGPGLCHRRGSVTPSINSWVSEVLFCWLNNVHSSDYSHISDTAWV